MKKLFIASALGASLIASGSYAADIVDTASSNGSFKTLVAAVQAAGLVAKVVTADVAADNGVIHVIDKVLMPPM